MVLHQQPAGRKAARKFCAAKMAGKLPDFIAATSDGKRFSVKGVLAEKFATFRDLHEDLGSNEIELGAVDSCTLRRILAHADAKRKAKGSVSPAFGFADLREALRYLKAVKYLGYDEGVPPVISSLDGVVRRAPLGHLAEVLGEFERVCLRWDVVREMADYPVAMVKLARAVLESEVGKSSALRAPPGGPPQRRGSSRWESSLDHLADTELGVAIPADVAETLLGKAHPTFLGSDEEPEEMSPWGQWLSPLTLAEYGLVSVLERWNWSFIKEGALAEPEEAVGPSQLDELSKIVESEIARDRAGMYRWLAGLDPLFFYVLEAASRPVWIGALHKAIITRNLSSLGRLEDLGLIGFESRQEGLRFATREGSAEAFGRLLERGRGSLDERGILLSEVLARGEADFAREALRKLEVPAEFWAGTAADSALFLLDDPRITPQ